jgi:hypothetical protein
MHSCLIGKKWRWNINNQKLWLNDMTAEETESVTSWLENKGYITE